MNPISYIRRSAVAAAAAVVFVVPGTGHAQTVTLQSSASAVCIGNCSTVRFTIDLNGTFYTHRLRLFSTNPSLWQFGGVLGVVDGNGTAMAFTSSVKQSGLILQALYPWTPTPVFVTAAMSQSATASQLHDGSLQYELLVSQDPTGATPRWEVTGTVTPEPGTLLLLGTGLAGVVGAARRRKRESTDIT